MQSDTSPFSKDEVFTALRPSLYAVAYHMLGNSADAEDIVQEAYLRWRGSDQEVRAPKAYLTTVVTRLCLKLLGSARVQREENIGSGEPAYLEAGPADPADPSDPHAPLADALSEALLVVLKALSPLERAVYLLREVFDCEYSDIAEMVDKNEDNCRQILRRARERVASRQPRYAVMPQQEERIVNQFVQAAAQSNWAGLIEALSEEATLECDGSDVGQGPVSVQGARAVAEEILRRASRWLGDGTSVQMIYFQGRPGILVCRDGLPVGSMLLSTRNGAIGSVRMVTCPVRLRSLLIVR
jgi:RNA polymerase sigma-70 factor (ECF subfamily)